MLCEDGGCDFVVELVGHTLRIRTISRLNQPPLGTLLALRDSGYGVNLVSSSVGEESRNEITSSFLVGGDVCELYLGSNIASFWGYDANGNPILGKPGEIKLKDKQGNLLQTVDVETMTLDAAPIADILGKVTYDTSDLEMRFAKHSYESWAMYMTSVRTKTASDIGMMVPFANMQGADDKRRPLAPDVVNDDPKLAKNMAKAIDGNFYIRSMRVYEFVRGYADEFLGRKYAVALPFVMQKQDDETLIITSAYEVTDGGYLPDGSEPLGLSELNEDQLKIQDGRFRAFVKYEDAEGIDFSLLNPQGVIVEGKSLFIAVDIDQNIVVTDTPLAVITLPGPVWEEALDATGDVGLVGAVAQVGKDDAKQLVGQAQGGNTPLAVSPAPRQFDAAAIPLKSNTLTYGPWFAVGAPGKTKFEQDPGLTPWNFGGFDILDQAGQARVSQAVTNQLVAESASLTYAGLPAIGLMDSLQTGGPQLTDVNVVIGEQGVTTTYQFRTYTARFGLFSKGYIERLRRMGAASQSLRRSMRAMVRQGIDRSEAASAAAKTARAFLQNAPKAIKRQSPHDLLIGRNIVDGSGVRVGVSSLTYPEAVALTNADDPDAFQATAAMSWSGLFRPFCTAPGSGEAMSCFSSPSGHGDFPNSETLNPWKGLNDVEVFLWGSGYDGMHAFRREVVGDNARVFGLRGPLTVAGWGYTVDGLKVPGSGAQGPGPNWDPDVLTRSDRWPAGPVDLLWDQNRGVWTPHTLVKGVLKSTVPPNGSGTMEVQTLGGAKWDTVVYDWFGVTALASGSKVTAEYIATDNRRYITGATCQN
jgi:hypothetical protein